MKKPEHARKRVDLNKRGDAAAEDAKDPLPIAEVKARFEAEARGQVPEKLRSIELPDPGRYNLKGITRASVKKVSARPVAPLRPNWVASAPLPTRVAVPARPKMRHRGREVSPLLIFNPDDRRTYNDRRYPWGTICRVVTATGTGSGVIVGPRHVLTASHVVDWSRDGAGTVEVHRAGGSVRATTSITRVWFFTKVTGTVDYFENDEDYAVLVTRDRIGDSFGWLGTRTYNSSWDGEPFWWNIGYPGDIGSGLTPTFQRSKELDEDAWDWGGGRSMSTDADTFFGNSGGPMFGFWDAGPYVVAVVSSQSSSENWCSGGDDMTRLVRHARTQDS